MIANEVMHHLPAVGVDLIGSLLDNIDCHQTFCRLNTPPDDFNTRAGGQKRVHVLRQLRTMGGDGSLVVDDRSCVIPTPFNAGVAGMSIVVEDGLLREQVTVR